MTQTHFETLAFQIPLPEEVLQAMPFFPGQLVLGVLVLISIAVWAIIFSKSFRFDQLRKSDRSFRNRLRSSKTCLEVFEEGEPYPNSPQFMIYQQGASSVAREVVGTSDPEFFREKQLFTEHSLSVQQLEKVSAALERGQMAALKNLSKGFRELSILAMAAAIVGLISSCVFMLQALNSFDQSFQRSLFFCLIILAASFMVTLPAGWFHFRLRGKFRKRMRHLIQFREAIEGVFKSRLIELEKLPMAVVELREEEEELSEEEAVSEKVEISEAEPVVPEF